MLKALLVLAKPGKEQAKDFDFLLNLGELFTLVVYGQLIIENAAILNLDDDLLDQIFDFMVRDFTKFAIQLYSKSSSTAMQQRLCKRMIHKPKPDKARFERVLTKHVYTLVDQYKMND